MSPRGAWAGCAAAGVAAFLCSWAFGRIGLVACGPTNGLGPIIAFELVRSPGDVAALFGSGACRAALIATQHTALLLDGLGFIPCYTAFLIFGTVAAGARGRTKAVIVTMLAVAGLSDEIEGHILARILHALPGTSAQMHALFWAVHIKFALLGLGTLAIGALLLRTRRPFAMLPAAVIGAGALIALVGLVQTPDPQMMTGFGIAWIALLLSAVTEAWRPSLFSPAHAVPPQGRAAPSA